MGTQNPGGEAANYTIGGVRLFFNELADAASTPVKYRGFMDLGNIVVAGMESTLEILEHFTAKSGTRKKDREVVSEQSEAINFTFDEPNVENCKLFFLGDEPSVVAAASAVAVTDEVIQLSRYNPKFVKYPYNASSIVVTDLTGSVTYVENTDYTVITTFGNKSVVRKAGGSIGDGDFLLVDYAYDQRAVERFNPGTVTERLGQCRIQAVSDTGNEFERLILNASIKPDGAFEYNSEDWSTFTGIIEILDNSDEDSSSPFGTFDHHGTGTDL